MDTFKQNMNNKTVKERLRTDPQNAFLFAVEYEEGINQHHSNEGKNAYKEVY